MVEFVPLTSEATPEPENLPSIQSQVQINVPEAIASLRAQKADFGLDKLSPGFDSLRQSIISGRELDARMAAASTVELDQRQKNLNLIGELAKKRGGPISSAEADFIMSMAERGVVDPLSVFEDNYAKKFIDYARITNPEGVAMMEDATKIDPKKVDEDKRVGASAVAYREFAQTQDDKAQAAYAVQSWAGWGVDQTKFLFPFYYDAKTRNILQNTAFFSPFLAGDNVDEAISRAYYLPYEEFKVVIPKVVDQLIKDNPSLATIFTHALVGRSTSERHLNNILPLLDVQVAFGLAKPALRGLISANQSRIAIRDVVKALEGPGVSEAKILTATGNPAEAAVSTVAKQMLEGVPKPADMVEPLLTNMRTDLVETGKNPGSLSREGVSRLNQVLSRVTEKFGELLQSTGNINKLTPEAIKNGLRTVQKEIATEHPNASGAFLDVGIHEHNPATNTYTAVYRIGTLEGVPFKEPGIAWRAGNELYGLPMQNGTVKVQPRVAQEGYNFFIEVRRPLREVDDAVRDGMVGTSYTATPRSMLNYVLGFLRTPEDTMSRWNLENRKILAYAPQEFGKLIHDAAVEIRAIRRGVTLDAEGRRVSSVSGGKKLWNDWLRILEIGRDMPDPANPKLKGYFFKNAGELEEHWARLIGGRPTEQQIRGYFMFKHINEMDRVFRDTAVFERKWRVGTEQIKLGPDSPWFDGIVKNELPKGKNIEANVLLRYGKEPGKLTKANQVPKDVLDKIKKGELKVVQVYDVASKPLRELSGSSNRIHYVVTDRLENKPITAGNQVPRRGGGHWEYEYDTYMKQARMRLENVGKQFLAHYEGDTTIMAIGNRIVGKKAVDALNDVRLAIKAGDEALAKSITESRLPVAWDEVRSWFTERTINGVKESPLINKDDMIHLVPNGQTVMDIDKTLAERYGASFRDATKDAHDPSRQMSVKFTGERDSELYTINDRGTKNNPVLRWEPAKLMDPLPMMNRAMQNIVHTRFLDDYKIASIEHWIQEFAKVLKATPSELRGNPLWHFSNPEYLKGAKAEDIAAAKIAWKNITDLMGKPSEVGARLHTLNQKLSDFIYEKAGPNFAGNAEIVQAYLLPKLADPFKYARSIAFHTKLGMFNWVQTLVQMNTMVHTLAIAGTHHGLSGTLGATFTQFTRLSENPEILAHFDKMISRIKVPGMKVWKPGEFTESLRELKKTGFYNIQGEHAFINDITDPGVFVSGAGRKILDAGSWFFKEGERMNRYTGWHTAFQEFRTANPLVSIGNAERNQILQRADLLTANMSRASSSAMHSGVFSVPFQFLSYQLRIAEQLLPFWSSRLTAVEKARAYAVYGALYGLPTAIGATGVGAPIAEALRMYAVNNSETPVNDGWLGLAMNGLLSHAVSMATGVSYDIGGRYGLQGITVLNDLIYSDKKWWELLTGASGSTIGNILAESSGFRKAMMSQFKDNGETFPLRGDDIVSMAKELSAFHKGYQTIIAYNTGILLSKKEIFLENIGPGQAVVQGLFGLQSNKQSDMHRRSITIESEKNLRTKVSQDIIREMQRGYDALKVNDEDNAKVYFKRANAMFHEAGLQPEHEAEIISKSARGYESLADSLQWAHIMSGTVDAYRRRYEQKRKEQGKQ